MGSNHGNLQNTPLLSLGYRELRDCRGVRYGERERGLNMGRGGTDNGGDNGEGGPGGTASGSNGAWGEAGARGWRGKTWGPLVGYVQPYQEAYVWDGAD